MSVSIPTQSLSVQAERSMGETGMVVDSVRSFGH
jgi:hypothetical protein